MRGAYGACRRWLRDAVLHVEHHWLLKDGERMTGMKECVRHWNKGEWRFRREEATESRTRMKDKERSLTFEYYKIICWHQIHSNQHNKTTELFR